MPRLPLLLACALMAASAPTAFGDDASPDYARVAPIFKTYCVGCHNDADREGEFSLESYPALMKGTEDGPALVAGDSAKSRLYKLMSGAAKPVMPPKDEPKPSAQDVALVKAWIDAGAPGPKEAEPDRLALVVPKIASRAKVRPITAMDASRDGKWLAVARYGAVDLHRLGDDPSGRLDAPTRTIEGLPGKVASVHFSGDGSKLITASGVTGLGGVASIWNVEDGALVRSFKGHLDLIFDAEPSPDGKLIATCSYDKTIQIWDAETGQSLRTLSGHNGAVYDVAFSPDGKHLVSASADDTCKVWRVEDGLRLDTLPQPLKEERACAFSPDGRRIVAAGADNTIRVWDFVSRDRPRINPMTIARFAHEGPIHRLMFTADGGRLVSVAEDRTIKVWDASDFTELKLWEGQPDVVSALAASPDGSTLRVGRMDGSTDAYPLPRTRPVATAAAATTPTAHAVAISAAPATIAEKEPNNAPEQAAEASLPAEIKGAISGRGDVDLYRFRAKAGEEWVVEVDAARSGSKLDSFVEVLDAHGGRVPRVLLQSVRDSYFTFRGKDDVTTGDFRVFNWEEMRLNEWLYANGEVVKLWLYPRGPDSGFLVYPGAGKRWGYFDTTPLSHPLGEPCYIVRPHPPGTPLIPNGLPVFTLYYENDDDARRELGKDSKLFFTAPADGDYHVRIRDVRGLDGGDLAYTLRIRPRKPEFRVKADEIKTPITPGGAQEFKLSAERIDGFDGPIRVEVQGLPAGFSASSPIEIEEGQVEALAVVAAAADAPAPSPEAWKEVKISAVARIGDAEVTHPVNSFGSPKLAEKPTLLVQIRQAEDGPRPVGTSPEGVPEFEIHPGETITLKVAVDRRGVAGPVSFGNEGSGRNLPFGVYVDNIGLNGLLITDDQSERTFFITADRSVPSQTRRFHLRATAAGGQASHPVILHVR